ncbi:hypothetical protein [Desulfosporosinus sp.]|uniref:hypothetical protein n=1 Tax=Desulfosporosinus sp. TaxID=157907 RepID=UPI0025C1914D|nr:hypothetical protein [Desulfosporosinus sp.]MBC2721844.1 hypothetical protein [Desulfosporosinus sp.]MBC2726252.1 hypothetical protein [Desulfosporosinus sp.]
MSVTDAARALILASTIATSIDNVDALSVKTIAGELVRITPQNVVTISTTERKYEFYLTENEGNGDLVGMSLYGNGATITLGDGNELATQTVTITKTNTQSLLIYWTVRVVV